MTQRKKPAVDHLAKVAELKRMANHLTGQMRRMALDLAAIHQRLAEKKAKPAADSSPEEE